MKKNKGLGILSLILALAIIVLGIIIIFMQINKKDDNKTLAYTDLIKQVTDGEIEKIEMTVGSTSVKVKVKGIEEEKKALANSDLPLTQLTKDQHSSAPRSL